MLITRLIFLDIDGVLNSRRYWESCGMRLPIGRAGAIDMRAVACLNQIVARTHARVVISSSWRSQGQERVERALRNRRFNGEVIGCTPFKLSSPRSAEIEEFLANWYGRTGVAPRSAILDDDPDAWHDDLDARFTRFFQTSFETGLTAEQVSSVVDWFHRGAS